MADSKVGWSLAGSQLWSARDEAIAGDCALKKKGRGKKFKRSDERPADYDCPTRLGARSRAADDGEKDWLSAGARRVEAGGDRDRERYAQAGGRDVGSRV